MLQFQCACGRLYQGKRGYWRLQDHVARTLKSQCALYNNSYFSGKILSGGESKGKSK